MSAIAAENVSAGYGRKLVLEHVSLQARVGEAVLLLGPNGAGKSTLLRVISGMLTPLAGRVFISNNDVTTWATRRRIEAGLGSLLQGGRVFPNLTVEENLAFAAEVAPARKGTSTPNDQIMEIADLSRKRKTRAGLLSGGERQLLALAMVLEQRPSILVLDEPTAGLAAHLRRGVVGALIELRRRHGSTMLIVEQDMEAGFELSDRVVLLRNGKVVDTGPVQRFRSETALRSAFFGPAEDARAEHQQTGGG